METRGNMTTVAEIIRIIDSMAPGRLAEGWDNAGLQYGDPGRSVSTVLIALDPTRKAIETACSAGAQMLVTHHPLIFKPLTQIDIRTASGSVIDLAARNDIAVFCAHTNLDSAAGGVNDVLAEIVGIESLSPLSVALAPQRYNIVVFAPKHAADSIVEAVSGTSAGTIGEYEGCAFFQEGRGRFVPGDSSTPHTGEPGRVSTTDEIRIEMPVAEGDLDDVIRRIREIHPYETMACDIVPLYREKTDEGLGRIGRLRRENTLAGLAREIRETMGLSCVKIAGSPEMVVRTAALCSGGGGGMVGDFLSSSADVYISGDLNHHAALDIAAAGKGVIDIGHFASERPVVPVLSRRIREACEKKGFAVEVIAWEDEPDPFLYIQ